MLGFGGIHGKTLVHDCEEILEGYFSELRIPFWISNLVRHPYEKDPTMDPRKDNSSFAN